MNAPQTTPRRYRGWLYVALHGPMHEVRAATIATDWLSACLVLADEADGDIAFCAPGEGAPLRHCLAGGPAPLPVRMQRLPVNLVTRISELAKVSRPTARAAVHEALRKASGAGGSIFREVEAIKARPGGRVRFSDLTGGAPV